MTDLDHPVFASLYDPVMALPERLLLGEYREFLAADISGRVLDVGAGTGAQFPYLADRDEVTSLDAIEPDSHMRRRAVERAADFDLEIRVEGARAESLPYDDDAFDAVVASFVFCTIPDQQAALDEAARVLAPGGEFRFVEHVRGTGGVGAAHSLLAPCWHAAAGGCHLDRETGDLFRRDDRFELLAYDRSETGVSRLLPIVRGRMRRRTDGSVLSRVLRSR